ncbi:hypothetical protein MRB53_007621 [Persea americana]|uniref:Uncharacterized protein n=1 Tax=Persea americana TaxID=3435 RepID=A0ACC2MK24_PERAE|nr:hypothetical protein MRB53_007621 [Persea americana]
MLTAVFHHRIHYIYPSRPFTPLFSSFARFWFLNPASSEKEAKENPPMLCLLAFFVVTSLTTSVFLCYRVSGVPMRSQGKLASEEFRCRKTPSLLWLLLQLPKKAHLRYAIFGFLPASLYVVDF